MFSVLSTPEKLKFENAIGHFGTRAGKSPDRHVIKKESVFKMFFVHIKAQGQRFQIPHGLVSEAFLKSSFFVTD